MYRSCAPKNNPKAFKQAFRYFVVLLKDMDLIDGKTIAIDSFKIRAQNSLKNNFNQKKIDRHIDYIDKKIEEYEKQLEGDLKETEQDKIEEKKNTQRQRRKEYKAFEKELKERGESQISTIDLDAKNLLKVENMNTLTDKGYTTGIHIDTCSKNGIITYSSPKAHSSMKNGLFDMQIFEYDSLKDSYRCPAGAIMQGNGIIYKKRNHKVKRYTTKSCQGCQLREKCTTNKRGRIIERSIYQEAIEANKKRVDENPEYYKLRQQITEHQFGTLKRQWGFTYTLMKGKENVLSEVNLMMMVYNLRRLMSILGINVLKSRLKDLVLNILAKFSVNRAILRYLNLIFKTIEQKYFRNLLLLNSKE